MPRGKIVILGGATIYFYPRRVRLMAINVEEDGVGRVDV